jgi:cell division protein FtsW
MTATLNAPTSATTSATVSLAERRRQALDRKGALGYLKLSDTPPTRTFYVIMIVITVFVSIGLVMVLSASSITSINRGGSAWTMFFRQLMWATVGTAAAIATYRMPYHIWKSITRPTLAAAFILNLLPFTPLGVTINGANAWVSMGPVSFQPSEFLKFALVVYSTNLLGRRQREITNARRTFLPVAAVWGASAAVCMAQQDLGGAIVMSAIAVTVLFMAGAPLRWISLASLTTLVGGVTLILMSASRRNRWLAFFNIEANKEHTGYQVYQSLLSIANGGIAGVGPGEGTSKWGYVPLAHSDFIFTVIAEEFGLLGSSIIILGFLVLALCGFQVALRARDRFGALLAAGITSWFVLQACINIGGVVGVMPVTGLTLPLISYGGSSLLITLAAAGLLLNVARNMRQSTSTPRD